MPKYTTIAQPGHLMDAAIVADIPNGDDQNAATCAFAACYANGIAAGTPQPEQDEYVFTLNLDSEPASVVCSVTRARTLPA